MRTTLLLLCALASAARAEPSPMRPAPVPSSRPPATGTIRHVDAARGADTNDGSAGAPWKTINTAIGKLKAGDTLYLHGGTYFEAVAVTTGGITIRSAPGELATIDGGLPEFQRTPATAWEPLANGEYRSTATYPALSKGPSEQGRGVWITGNFASSMVPLHGYRLVEDLRSKNEYFDFPGDNLAPRAGIYVGPGVWLDRTTHRIHARFAPTTLRSQPVNYAGGDDPRKLALVIGADRIPLSITASHVRIQDLVVRGSATHTVHVDKASHVELDGLTIFGGSPALWVEAAGNFKLVRSTVRGLAAPWSSRAGMKYRGNSPYLVIASSRGAQSHDWELAYNDFVDSHDGLVLDSVRSLRFHHNLVDNFNDDAVYLTFPPRVAPGDDQQYYENVFARANTFS